MKPQLEPGQQLIAPFGAAVSGQSPSLARGWYLVGILLIANIFSFVDRQILVLLVDPIKQSMALTDTDLGLLQGFAFTLFFSLLSLPLGRYVDRANRRNLLITGVAIWSLATLFCGLSNNYMELFSARMLVGLGEAALAPAAYSMIADSFPPQRRGVPIGIFTSGIYLGIGMALLLGGMVIAFIAGHDTIDLWLLGTVQPWQAAFIAVSLPGIPVVVLLLTVKEPPRGHAPQPAVTLGKDPALLYAKTQKHILAPLILGYMMLGLATFGAGSWIPSLLIRVHHWSAPQAAVGFGLSLMLFGTVGGIVSGYLADRMLGKGRNGARLNLTMIGTLCWIPLITLAAMANNGWVTLACFAVACLFDSTVNCLGPASIQDITPPYLRGQAIALFFFIVNMLGLGTGPTAIALVTDKLFHGSPDALRYAIPIIAVPAALIGVGLLLMARTPFKAEVQQLKK